MARWYRYCAKEQPLVVFARLHVYQANKLAWDGVRIGGKRVAVAFVIAEPTLGASS